MSSSPRLPDGAGGDGDGVGIASLTYEVLRTTIGDSATPLDFSVDGIDNLVNLGSGNDTVFGGGGSNFIVGNGGNDELIGGGGGGPSGPATPSTPSAATTICRAAAGSPSDVLVATGSGNDTFYGGTGNNYIVGGTGKNTIVGRRRGAANALRQRLGRRLHRRRLVADRLERAGGERHRRGAALGRAWQQL